MSCHQVIGAYRERYGKFAEANVNGIAEKRDIFIAEIQERQDISDEVAENDLNDQKEYLK